MLEADAATIMLAEEDERLSVRASVERGGGPAHRERRSPQTIAFGEGFAGRVALEREAMLIHRPVTR